MDTKTMKLKRYEISTIAQALEELSDHVKLTGFERALFDRVNEELGNRYSLNEPESKNQ